MEEKYFPSIERTDLQCRKLKNIYFIMMLKKKIKKKKNTNYLFHNAAKFIYINYLSHENILLLN